MNRREYLMCAEAYRYAHSTEMPNAKGIGKARAAASIKSRPHARKDELVQKKILPESVYNEIEDSERRACRDVTVSECRVLPKDVTAAMRIRVSTLGDFWRGLGSRAARQARPGAAKTRRSVADPEVPESGPFPRRSVVSVGWTALPTPSLTADC